MKILVVSDLHGSEYYAKRLKEIFEREKADKIFLLRSMLQWMYRSC